MGTAAFRLTIVPTVTDENWMADTLDGILRERKKKKTSSH